MGRFIRQEKGSPSRKGLSLFHAALYDNGPVYQEETGLINIGQVCQALDRSTVPCRRQIYQVVDRSTRQEARLSNSGQIYQAGDMFPKQTTDVSGN